MNARLCPTCYAGTPPEATHCWMCHSALPPFEQRLLPNAKAVAHLERPAAGTPRAAPPPALQRTPNERIGFGVAALAGMLALSLVAVELFRFAPGLLVLLALLSLPILGLAMGVLIYQARSPKQGSGDPNETKEQVAAFVGMMAVGVGWVLIAVATIFVTMIAGILLLMVLCFGIVMLSQGMH